MRDPISTISFEFSNHNGNGGILGSITVGKEDAQRIFEISKNGAVDKFDLVYRDYAFELVGATFNSVQTLVLADSGNSITFQFLAKDVHLKRRSWE